MMLLLRVCRKGLPCVTGTQTYRRTYVQPTTPPPQTHTETHTMGMLPPRDVQHTGEVALLFEKAADCIQNGDLLQAIQYNKAALEKQCETLPPEHVGIGECLHNLGFLYISMQDYKTALPYLQRSYNIIRNALPPHDVRLAIAMYHMACAHEKLGDLQQAKSYSKESLYIMEKTRSKDDKLVVLPNYILGQVLEKLGNFEEAIERYELCRNVYKKQNLYLTNTVDTFSFLFCLCKLYEKLEQWENLVQTSLEALELIKQTSLEIYLLKFLKFAGLGYTSLQDHPKAIPLNLQYIQISQKVFEKGNADIVDVLENLCMNYIPTDMKTSLEYQQRVFDMRQQLFPSDRTKLASSYYLLATIYFWHGDYPKALKACLETLEIIGTSQDHPDLPEILLCTGIVYKVQKEDAKAAEYIDKGLALLPPEHKSRTRIMTILEKMTADASQQTPSDSQNENENSQKSEDSQEFDESIHQLIGNATNFARQRQTDQAIPLFLQALEKIRSTRKQDDCDVASCLTGLGGCYFILDDLTRAKEYIEEAYQIYNRILPKNHRATAFTIQQLGFVFAKKGEYKNSLYHGKKSLEMMLSDNVSPEDPLLIPSLELVGGAHYQLGNLHEARDKLEECVRLRKKHRMPDFEIGNTLRTLTEVYEALGNIPVAIGVAQDSLEHRRRALPQYHPTTGSILSYLAHLCEKVQDYERSLEYSIESLDIFNKSLPPGNKEVAQLSAKIVQLCHRLGPKDASLYQQALHYAQMNVEFTQRVYGDIHAELSMSLLRVGVSCSMMGDLDEAQKYFFAALDIIQKVNPSPKDLTANILECIGDTYLNQKSAGLALHFHQLVLDLIPELPPEPKHAREINLLYRIVAEHDTLKSYEQSMKAIERIHELQMKNGTTSPSEKAKTLSCFALSYVNQGEYEKALFSLDEAMRLIPREHPLYATCLEIQSRAQRRTNKGTEE